MLTDKQIKAIKPEQKTKRYTDGQGMYLEVSPSGTKAWRLKYRLDGKEKRISLGVYPTTSLKQARLNRDEARALIAQGIDPSSARKAGQRVGGLGRTTTSSKGDQFSEVAAEWLAAQRETWAPRHTETVESRLNRDVIPAIGSLPVTEVSPAIVLEVLRRIEARGTVETAKRVRVIIGQVMRYAAATDRCSHDPTAVLKGALKPKKVKHYDAPITPEAVGRVLRRVEEYEQCRYFTKMALRFAPRVIVRAGTVVTAKWAHIDFDGAMWAPPEGSTTKQVRAVPLSTQAQKILTEVWSASGHCEYVFPNDRSWDRPMSNGAMGKAYKKMGLKGEIVPHGWRATARTLLTELLGFRPEVVEHQLGHVLRDPLGRAYNRTTWLPERVEMMQCWADALDEWRQQSSSETK